MSVFQVTSKATGTNMDLRTRPIDQFILRMDRTVVTGNLFFLFYNKHSNLVFFVIIIFKHRLNLESYVRSLALVK